MDPNTLERQRGRACRAFVPPPGGGGDRADLHLLAQVRSGWCCEAGVLGSMRRFSMVLVCVLAALVVGGLVGFMLGSRRKRGEEIS